jgi:hypothetical protein
MKGGTDRLQYRSFQNGAKQVSGKTLLGSLRVAMKKINNKQSESNMRRIGVRI